MISGSVNKLFKKISATEQFSSNMSSRKEQFFLMILLKIPLTLDDVYNKSGER